MKPLVWILNPKRFMAGTADAVVKGQKVHTYLARSVIGPPMALLMDQIWSQTVTTTSFSDFMVLTRRFQGAGAGGGQGWSRSQSISSHTHPQVSCCECKYFQHPFQVYFHIFSSSRHAKTSQVLLHYQFFMKSCLAILPTWNPSMHDAALLRIWNESEPIESQRIFIWRRVHTMS